MTQSAALDLIIQLKGDADKQVNGLSKSILGLGKSAVGVGATITKAIGGIALGTAVAGVAGLGAALASGISDAREAAIVFAQTENVIKTTGGAAGVSAQHVSDFAASLSAASGMSLFGDDQIQQSTNLLLTFKNIKGETLDLATALTTDLAQALGGAPADQAMLLGKALENPIAGMSALRRVGLTFTEQQQEQIKTMQESGDLMGAQSLIIAELNSQVGGSARAAAIAEGGWAQFRDRMGELAESIGAKALPMLNQLVGVLNSPAVQAGIQAFADGLVTGVGTALTWLTETAIPALITGWQTIQPAITVVSEFLTGTLIPAFQVVAEWLQVAIPTAVAAATNVWSTLLQPAFVTIGAVITETLVPAFMSMVTWLTQNWTLVQQVGTAVAAAVVVFQTLSTVAAIVGSVTLAIAGMGAAVTTAGSVLGAIVAVLGGPVTLAIAGVALAAGLLYAAWVTNFGGIQEKTAAVWSFIQSATEPVITVLSRFWTEVQPQMIAAWENIQRVVTTAWNTISSVALTVGGAIFGFITSHMSQIQAVFSGTWTVIQGIVQVAWALVSGIIKTGLAVLSGDWAGAWEAIKATFSGVWEGIKTILSGALTVIKAELSIAWDAIKAVAVAAWDALRAAIAAKIGEVVALAAGIGSRIVAAVGNLGSLLISAGASVVQGLIDGIKSKIGAVASVLSGITAMIPQIKGPPADDAKLLFENGRLIVQGLIDGFGAMKPELVKQLTDITDLIGKVFSLLSSGSTALPKLGEFETPSSSNLNAFTSTIDTILTQLSGIAGTFKKEALEHASTFAESASKVSSLIGTAVDNLTKLASYKTGQISKMLLARFAHDVYESVRVLQGIAEKFDAEAMGAAAWFGENAGKLIGIIGTAVDNLTKLGSYKAGQISQMALARFAGDVFQSIKVLSGISTMFEQEGMAEAAEFAEHAGSVIGLIGTAVDSFQSLAEYEDIATTQFEMLAADIDDAVWLLVQMAQNFDTDGTEAAAVFATAVGKIIAPISEAVSAFTALAEYKGIMPWMLDMLAADIRLTVEKMVDMAAKFDVEGVEAAAVFGTAVSKIIAPISDAVDTFTALREYEGVLPASVQLIGNDIAGTVGLMAVIASQANTEGVAAAAVFSEAVEQVFAGLKRGIDALTALQDYEGIPQEKMDQFVGDMQRAFAIMLTMDVPAGEAIPTLLTNAGQIASALAGIGASATSAAAAVVTAVGSVNSALASIPRTITVHINAVVDPALERHSPSIIEQTLMNIAHLIETMPQLGSLLTDAARKAPQEALDELIKKVRELESEQEDLRNKKTSSGADRDRNNKRLSELDKLIADAEKDVTDGIAGLERAVTKGLFDLGSAFGSIGTAIGQYGLRPLTGNVARIAAELKAVDDEIADAAERSRFVYTTADAENLARLEQRRALLVQEQAGTMAEQLALQKQLLALQEQQDKLNFLGQQQKLLDLIQQYKLNPADILGNVQLGLDASIGGITEAMTRALAAIVEQINARFPTAPVVGPVPPAQTNTWATMPNLVTMPNLTAQAATMPDWVRAPIAVTITFEDGAIQQLPGEDGRQFAERVSEIVVNKLDRRDWLSGNR